MSTDLYISLVDDSIIREKILPAVNQFIEHEDSDSAAKLVNDAVGRKNLSRMLSGEEVFAYYVEECGRTLSGQYERRVMDETSGEILLDERSLRAYKSARTVSRFLVFYLATIEMQDKLQVRLSRDALAFHLRSRSPWLDQVFSLSNEVLWEAEPFNPAIGTDAWLLTAAQSKAILDAVRAVGVPANSAARTEYSFLIQILEQAIENRNYRILVRVQ